MAEKATSPGGAPAAPSEQEVRELLMRGESVRQQLGTLEAQREYLMELMADARRALATVEHIAAAKDGGEEILIPLGAGTFVAGKLAHDGKAITSLGSGIHAEMPAEQARERLAARMKSLEDTASQLGRDITRLTEEMMRINAIAESVYGG